MNCPLCGKTINLRHRVLSRGTVAMHEWCFFVLLPDKEFDNFLLGMDVGRAEEYRAEREELLRIHKGE